MTAEAILLDFPNQIETERLILRSPRPGDGAALHRTVSESQTYLRDWMIWAVNIPDAQGYEKLVREKHLAFQSRTELMLIILSKENGKLIGATGFHNINWDTPSFEIGYWLHPSYTGRGYVTEAVRAQTEFAFDTLNAERIEIRCDANNKASSAVAERAGYQLDVVFKNHDRHHITKELTDTMVFSKLK